MVVRWNRLIMWDRSFPGSGEPIELNAGRLLEELLVLSLVSGVAAVDKSRTLINRELRT